MPISPLPSDIKIIRNIVDLSGDRNPRNASLAWHKGEGSEWSSMNWATPAKLLWFI